MGWLYPAPNPRPLGTPVQWRRNEYIIGQGGTARGAGRGYCSGAKSAGYFFGRALKIFGSKSTNSRFGERLREGQYSLGNFKSRLLGSGV